MRAMKHVLSVFFLAVLLSGCLHEEPNRVYMPDMAYSPAYKAQEPGGMRTAVKGTVSRDYVLYPYPNTPQGAEAAGKELVNPLQATQVVLIRGQALFNTYCIVCHGPTGTADGSIVPKFPKPLSLHTARARGYPDGRIFHIISNGQNLMPSYATQIEAADRWAIIHYVRVLQRSYEPTAEDRSAAQAAGVSMVIHRP